MFEMVINVILEQLFLSPSCCSLEACDSLTPLEVEAALQEYSKRSAASWLCGLIPPATSMISTNQGNIRISFAVAASLVDTIKPLLYKWINIQSLSRCKREQTGREGERLLWECKVCWCSTSVHHKARVCVCVCVIQSGFVTPRKWHSC